MYKRQALVSSADTLVKFETEATIFKAYVMVLARAEKFCCGLRVSNSFAQSTSFVRAFPGILRVLYQRAS